MNIAIIEIGGRLAARIDDAGNVETIEPSARLSELIAEYKFLLPGPGLIGLTPALSAARAMEVRPEFSLTVNIEDMIVGDIVGGVLGS